jgi:signal transduction histidine kinase
MFLNVSTESPKDRIPLSVARLCGLLAALIALLALTGWISGIRTLASWGTDNVPMAPSTALLFLLLGTALITVPHRRRGVLLAARAGAMLIVAVSLLRIAEIVTGIPPLVDLFRFTSPEELLHGVPLGRMAAVTAMIFLISGFSLLFMTLPRASGTTSDVAGMLAIVAGAMGVTFGLGYLAGKPILYSGDTIPMAPSTAAGFALVGTGILVALVLTDVPEPGRGEGRLRLSIGRKVLGGFGLALAAVFYVSVLAYNNTIQLLGSARLVAHTHEMLAELEGTIASLKAVESSSRSFVISGDDQMQARAEHDSLEVEGRLERLRGLIADNERQQLRVAAIEPLIRKQVWFNRQIALARRDGGVPSVTDSLRRSGGGMQEIRNIADEMEREERLLLRDRSLESEADVHNAIATYALLVLIVFGILVGIYFVVHRDLTGRLRAEEESRQLALRLEASNRDLEGFNYSISHDLRAPIRHIEGYGERLRLRAGAALDEEGSRFLSTILESVRHLSVLIDDLLVFSRMGQEEIEWSRVPTESLVRDTIRTLERECAGRDIDWRIGHLPEVRADRSMLRLVFLNLIENALKYTRPRASTCIEIECTDRVREKEFFVRDNGVGFDMQYADKLFGVFQRLHPAAEFEGTGIGLANVRRIIQRHGGRTWAEGSVGGGAAFFFTLPEGPVIVTTQASGPGSTAS